MCLCELLPSRESIIFKDLARADDGEINIPMSMGVLNKFLSNTDNSLFMYRSTVYQHQLKTHFDLLMHSIGQSRIVHLFAFANGNADGVANPKKLYKVRCN